MANFYVTLLLSFLLTISAFAQVVPTPSHPPDGATNQPTTVTLRWVPVLLATSYDVQVSTSSDFNSILRDLSGIGSTSTEVRGLSEGTTFYWRVRAVVSLVPGLWSSTSSFATVKPEPPLPASPTLSSPPNGATNQLTALTLSWNSVPDADSYTLQVSKNSSFSSLIVDQPQIASTSREISGLLSGATYYWRVSAQNSAGTGGWSDIWSFTTRAAVPGIPTLISPADGATDIQVPVTLVWNQVPGADTYRVQISKENTFSSPATDESSITAESYEAQGLSSGDTYYWHVLASNASGSGGWSGVWRFTTVSSDPSAYNLNKTIDFPLHENLSDYSPADYKILGLPGASNAPLTDFLPGNAGEDWQAYWDNGRETDYWVAYDGGPTFIFSVGRAFWILNRGPWTINETVPSPETNANGEVKIPIHEGWNLITCPYLSSVLWPEVQQLNSTNEPLYRYIDGRYGNSGYLEPYTGYYFFNENDASTLLIPPEDNPDPPGRRIHQTSWAEGTGWRINIVADNGTVTDDLLWLGSEAGATPGKDPVDVHKPRAISGFGSYFNRREWDERYPNFAVDLRPPVETTQTWTFSIESERVRDIRLLFRNLDKVPAALALILVDHKEGRTVDLRESNNYVLQGTRGVATLSLLIGRDRDITGIRTTTVPATFALGSNYPNPFNLSTTIPFELPRESDVKIAVHDLLGRKIRTLVSGMLAEGRHRVTWDGRNDNGEVVNSGIYFCRLALQDGSILSRPMVLAK